MGVLSLSHRLVKLLARVETRWCNRINATNFQNSPEKNWALSALLKREILAFLLPDKIIIFNGNPKTLGVTMIKVIHLNKNDLRGDTNFNAIDITPLSYIPHITRVKRQFDDTYRMITPFNAINDLVRINGLQAGERVKLEYEGNAAKRVYYSNNINYELNPLIEGEIREGIFKLLDWMSNRLSGNIHFGGEIDVKWVRELLKLAKGKPGDSFYNPQLNQVRGFLSLGIKTEDGETGLSVGNISKRYLGKKNAKNKGLPPDSVESFIAADLPPTNMEQRMEVKETVWKYIPEECSLCYGSLDRLENIKDSSETFFIGFNGWEGDFNSFTLLTDLSYEKNFRLQTYYPDSV